MRKYQKNLIPAFMQEFIENPHKYLIMKNISPFSMIQLGQIWTKYIDTSKDIPNLVILEEISSNFEDLLIVGDTHGDFLSTIKILEPFLNEEVDSVVFLGDYVDRGDYSFINIVYLVSISIVWPDRVILLRGNHEDLSLNLIYGFYRELQTYFPIHKEFQTVLAIIDAIYNSMSLVAITPKNTVCMHAGIPKGTFRLKMVDSIPKPHKNYKKLAKESEIEKIDKIFTQIRWNDPIEEKLENENHKSYHGYFYYTLEEIEDFLKENKVKRIVRSHEHRRGGFQKLFSSQLYHIFSTEPYFGKIEKAFIIHEQKNGEITLKDLNFNFYKLL